jgi:uncharacterized protein YqjF (DUF2071 family)
VIDRGELAILGALAASRIGLDRRELLALLDRAGVSDGKRATEALRDRGLLRVNGAHLDLTSDGVHRFLDLQAQIEEALDVSPKAAGQEECPSIPWLTLVQTKWIDAVSVNYAVDPAALAKILPAPLTPEVWKGTAWVQLLMSSLRDMRPQGLGALFGVNFYQVSYRAAVRYPAADGATRRGGYFVRSETNHHVMRAVGNSLAEFKFHAFGQADMVMLRDGDRLTIGVDPEAQFPGGKVVGLFDTRPLTGPPPGSVWNSVEELDQPLIECYDALGVDRPNGFLYILTIDRDPWRPWFVKVEDLYCEYFTTGALGHGASKLDSVLHFRECGYRWRPLRREKLA